MNNLTPDSQALSAGARLEEFVIERVLGSGGFGITYLAYDTSLGRQVVIKENLPVQFAWRETTTGTVRPRHTSGGDAEDFQWSMNNFLREAETLASLDHPGIVRVLRKFKANGTAYFVMPFVDGVAFDELIKVRSSKGQAFSEEELKGVLVRLLDALGYLHDRGIYHRDIKPGNILISNNGEPALIDFGSARQRLSDRSMTVVESAGYTPFEQLQTRGDIGPWSDLYALGATIEMAIISEAPPKAADRIGTDSRVPLVYRPALVGRLSSALLTSIDRALEVDTSNRWQSAGQWREALLTAQADWPSSSTEDQSPLAFLDPVDEWERKNRLAEKAQSPSWNEEDLPRYNESQESAPQGGDTAAPALWNPTTAVNLSVLLTPAFGTFLHARNAKALGIPKVQETGMLWFYVMCAYIVLGTLLGLSGGYFLVLNVLMLCLWYFLSAKRQVSLVKERYGKEYPRKSLVVPVCTCIFWIFAISNLIDLLHVRARNEVSKSLSQEMDATSGNASSSEENSEELAISYFNRGVEYTNGDGVAQNHEEAVKWYRKAAEAGNAGGMRRLGVCYVIGMGVTKDAAEAVKWFRKAAEAGDAGGMTNLGRCYEEGEGVAKDEVEAVKWYRKVLNAGNIEMSQVAAGALKRLGR